MTRGTDHAREIRLALRDPVRLCSALGLKRSPALSVVGECWEWRGRKDKDGYGKLRHARREWRAHRLVFALTIGSPDGLCVLHRCDNPACVRPDHLFLGTNLENIADRVAKGRSCAGPTHPAYKNSDLARSKWAHRKSVCHGKAHWSAKLDEEKVRQLRELRRGGMSQRALAARYSVTRNAVRSVLSGRSWRHVQ